MIHIEGGASHAEPLRWILDQLILERANRLPGAAPPRPSLPT